MRHGFRLRASFAARLMAALAGLVVVVAGALTVLIGGQATEQVRTMTVQAAELSRRAFAEVEELHREQIARLARAFTGSRRTLAALEAALESGETQWLVETARYELELARQGNGLAAFTNGWGDIVVTMLDGRPVPGDPADVAALAEAAAAAGSGVTAYRVVDGRLFLLTVEHVELAGRAIGTVTFGVRVSADRATHLGQAAGVDVCFAAAGRCIVTTAGEGSPLARAMAAASAGARTRFTDDAGRRWVLVGEALGADAGPAIQRVIAVPIDTVVAPFERIRAFVLWTGALALLFALALGWVLSRRLARPVRELVGATDAIARGELDTRVAVRRQDELGTLAASFNAMAEGLALKERYRDVLKKVVSRDVAEDLMAGHVQLGGETRMITVVFADLVGFTAFSEGRDPRSIVALLNECMTAWTRAIDEEGGVVDKYMGDTVMALFGAPLSHPDDARRALRAALRMQQATEEINRARRDRGESELGLAIGVATGPAVAGNVGSPDRLNYTVIGSTVNLAARLCDVAAAGEILMSEATRDAAGPAIPALPYGERDLHGFSRPVPVFAAASPHAPPPHAPPPPEPSAAAAGRAAALALAALLLTGGLAGAAAQDRGPGLPTLAGLGLSYLSPGGTLQIDLSGRLDLEAYVPQDVQPWLVASTDPFLAGRLRLLTDVFIGDRVYGLFELRADRGEAPAAGDVEARIEQAFVRFDAWKRLGLQFQLGKFALPFGGYPERHHTPADPFIRPPLAYEYRTLATPTVAPAATAGFLDWKNEEATRRPNGSPQVWSVPYPWGGLLAVGRGEFVVRAAAVSAAPSSPPEQWSLESERLRHPTFIAGAAWQPIPELRLAVAHSRGPWLGAITTGALPANTGASDFTQRIWNAEVVFARGRTTLRGETFINRWEVPNLGQDPGDVSWYVEAQQRLAAGLFVAARWNELYFDELDGPDGAEIWDRNTRRIQLGAGLRLLHNTELRAEYMINRTDGSDPRDDLISLQWWWRF